VIVLDFLGSTEIFDEIRESVRNELGRLLGLRSDAITMRHVVTEGGADAAELWVELSSEEQVFRRGREIAAALTGVVRIHTDADVWVLFRVVPLSHAFLNGEARARGRLAGDA